jgi:hypothetical protein
MVWARTLATESGAGGKAMPLDPFEDPAGNVAVRAVNDRGGLVALVLRKDETHDTFTELRAMPHAATCTPADPQLPIDDEPPANVVDFAAAHRARGARR